MYKSEYFYGDKWKEFSLDFDFNRSFFSQLQELQEKSPRPHMLGINNENCDYSDDTWNSKNCFLSSSALNAEALFYSYRNINCSFCSDIVYCHFCENCHDLTLSSHNYKVFYGFNVKNSSHSKFLYDCRNVKHCFMCWNLRDKEYCIFNKQYTKQEYEKFLMQYNFWSSKEIKRLKEWFFEHLKVKAYFPQDINVNIEKSTWNFLSDCKNCENCFLLEESEDCIDIFRWYKSRNSYACTWLLDSENCFMVNQSSYLYNVDYASYCAQCKESNYLDNCQNCSYCFWCVGLKNKQYCILNKQYAREEYFSLKKEIEDYMKKNGEKDDFFPFSMMYSGYNTTLARMYYPKTKQEIEWLGRYWEDWIDILDTKAQGEDFPDDIKDITSDMYEKRLICEKTGNVFNFTAKMLELHKKNGIALPRITHIERLVEKYLPLSYIKPFETNCVKSGKKIIHYYPKSLWYKNIVSREEYEKIVY